MLVLALQPRWPSDFSALWDALLPAEDSIEELSSQWVEIMLQVSLRRHRRNTYILLYPLNT